MRINREWFLSLSNCGRQKSRRQSPEFADILGNADLAGTDLGDAQVDATITPDGDNFVVDGGVTSVNLDFDLIESLGLELFSINDTGTPADNFAVGFPIVGSDDDTPFTFSFSTEDGLTPVSGDIDHEGRVVLEPSGNANFAAEGTERDALAEYLAEFFPNSQQAYDEGETTIEEDLRIQNVNSREDTVFDRGDTSEELLTTEIFRFRTGDGTYLYVSAEERQSILDASFDFVDEGKAFNVSAEADDDLIPIYRFRNTDLSASYLYVGAEERQAILDGGFNFVEEGLAFYTFGADAQQADDITRFQTVPGGYVFVNDTERQSILNSGFNFTEEGTAFEALV